MTQSKQPLRIYIDHLKEGDPHEIAETLDPSFLDIQESDGVRAKKPIVIEGSAYLVGEFLILSLDIQTELEIPCAVCNEPFSIKMHLPSWTHEEPLAEIKKGVFDFSQVLRDTVLLEIPFYPQCGGKTCANRQKVEKYLKKDEPEDKSHEEYRPFENLL